ncbi:uncharacterized protein EDB91DRAFT_1164367 [Suillus paluster]|uniref:uncharacterized protein n=1 Tax=Suillus paluster TaxID=48578 RepID=UPI001B862118|nr:uncharacterized protein EDB91DRAFT_1164367 [Suillus paluster]KAG1727278.1 hypothetical protein EDB91DRAFT_1164367 [Suillus paluster]
MCISAKIVRCVVLIYFCHWSGGTRHAIYPRLLLFRFLEEPPHRLRLATTPPRGYGYTSWSGMCGYTADDIGNGIDLLGPWA